MTEYKKYKLDENQIYKMAQEFYNDCGLKNIMKFEVYFKMILPQIQAYTDLDDPKLRKMMLQSQQIMLNRTQRGINKLKKEHESRKKYI